MPDKLALAAVCSPGSTDGINTFTAPATGGSWSLQSGACWGGAIAESAYVIGATLTKNGQPVTAWRGNAGEGVPPGLDPADRATRADLTESCLATDAASGAVVLAGDDELPGRAASTPRRSCPAPARASCCLRSANGMEQRAQRPHRRSGRLRRLRRRQERAGSTATAARSKTLASGSYWSATVCAGPEGRLWIAWGDTRGGLFVTRSNHAASAFEPVQKLTLPPGTRARRSSSARARRARSTCSPADQRRLLPHPPARPVSPCAPRRRRAR